MSEKNGGNEPSRTSIKESPTVYFNPFRKAAISSHQTELVAMKQKKARYRLSLLSSVSILDAFMVHFTCQRRETTSITARRTPGFATGAGLRAPETKRSATPIFASLPSFRFVAISWIPPIVCQPVTVPGFELQKRKLKY